MNQQHWPHPGACWKCRCSHVRPANEILHIKREEHCSSQPLVVVFSVFPGLPPRFCFRELNPLSFSDPKVQVRWTLPPGSRVRHMIQAEAMRVRPGFFGQGRIPLPESAELIG